jgi:GNAT superfamily N-acetyltransferase
MSIPGTLTAAESPIRGLGARLGGTTAPLVGITHYLFHAHAWMTREVCYLQDLFVDATVRRQGCGAKLIEAVAAIARERGCARLYWTTKENNATCSTTASPGSTASSATTTRWNKMMRRSSDSMGPHLCVVLRRT